jgi:hypothetical protein
LETTKEEGQVPVKDAAHPSSGVAGIYFVPKILKV